MHRTESPNTSSTLYIMGFDNRLFYIGVMWAHFLFHILFYQKTGTNLSIGNKDKWKGL